MKKYLSVLTLLSLYTATFFSNSANITVNLKNKDFNIVRKSARNPGDSLENWYQFLAPNVWKVSITRATWVDVFLVWMGDALIGKMYNDQLRNNIYNEYKSWPNNGNRNFSDANYSLLVSYTLDHSADISHLIFNYPKINRIMFQAYTDYLWVGVFDASI